MMNSRINQNQFLDALRSPSQTPISEVSKPLEITPNSLAVARILEQEKAAKNETPQDREFITTLFARLNTVCTAGFHNLKMLNTSEAQAQIQLNMREWLDEFKANKMDRPELIDYAMARIRSIGSPFIPTVGEFMALCDEGRLPVGTKNESDSYSEMLKYNCLPRERREPSRLSAETYHTFSVICETGNLPYFKNLNEAKAFAFWASRHKETLKRMKNGQALKTAPAATARLERIRVPASRQVAMSALKQMRAGL